MRTGMTDPTPELREAVRDAIHAEDRTQQQDDLLAAYFDVTCGDCETGRCHGGSGPCGCARHEVSARWGALDQSKETR